MPFFFVWNLQRNNLFFAIWVIFRNISRMYFFSILAYKTLSVIVALFFSNFFQLSFSIEKFILSQLYLFIKGLILVIPCGSFYISLFLNLTRLLQHIGKIYYLFYWCDLLFIFCFYAVRTIYIWSITMEIYFMAFIIQ